MHMLMCMYYVSTSKIHTMYCAAKGPKMDRFISTEQETCMVDILINVWSILDTTCRLYHLSSPLSVRYLH